MYPFKRYKIRSYEMGLYFRDGEFRRVLEQGTHWFIDPLRKVAVDVVSRRATWLTHDKLDLIVKSGRSATAPWCSTSRTTSGPSCGSRVVSPTCWPAASTRTGRARSRSTSRCSTRGTFASSTTSSRRSSARQGRSGTWTCAR